jgi:hypothetical protein
MASAFQMSPVVRVLEALGEVTDILKLFLNHVCSNTQAMLKFEVMNFLYATPPKCSFLNGLKIFGKYVKTTCSVLWCVLINCCAENIQNLQLSLFVEFPEYISYSTLQ